jgi:hypothetical protein
MTLRIEMPGECVERLVVVVVRVEDRVGELPDTHDLPPS